VDTKKIRIFVVLLLVILAGIGAWFLLGGQSQRRIRNILLISIDTCRADHLSCYGYPQKITPNIDMIAGEGIVFENVVSPVPITLPAHSSMLTGTVPPYHGVHDNYDYRLADGNVTLAEILKDKGFTTGAIISAIVMDSQFGINQGFDYYNDRFKNPLGVPAIIQRKGSEATSFAIKWLEENKNENFFLFLHYFDPHADYEPPEPFRSAYAGRLYAGEIAYTDYCIGAVIEKLKNLGLYDSTLIIITSDHGESLGEHLEKTHDYFIYQSTLKVPLIFKIPGVVGSKRVGDIAGLIDIVPTVCGILGIQAPKPMHGRDLSPYFRRKRRRSQDRHLYCECLTPQRRYNTASLLGVVTNRFKYIQTTRPELYDLVKDPREINNLIKQQPQQGRILQDRLKQTLEQTVRRGLPDSRLELDERARRNLESLGYVDGGGATEDFSFDQSRDDPKDLIEFHLASAKAYQLIVEKKYREAERLCEKLLLERPDFDGTYKNLSRIAEEEGDEDKAVAYLVEALEVNPDNARILNKLGVLLSEYGRPKEAFKYFAESLRVMPEQITAHNRIAWLLYQDGKTAEAIVHYVESLRIKHNQPKVHNVLAELLYTQGKTEKAFEYWKQAIHFQPDLSEALNNLAWIMAVHEDDRFRNASEACRYAQKACELTEFKNPDLLDTLSAAYAAVGKFDKAIETAEKALKLYRNLEEEKKADDLQNRLELFRTGQPYREKL